MENQPKSGGQQNPPQRMPPEQPQQGEKRAPPDPNREGEGWRQGGGKEPGKERPGQGANNPKHESGVP